MKFFLSFFLLPFFAKCQNERSVDSYLNKIKINFSIVDSAFVNSKEDTNSSQFYLNTLDREFNSKVFFRGRVDTSYFFNIDTKRGTVKLGLLNIHFKEGKDLLYAEKKLQRKKREDEWNGYLMLTYSIIANNNITFIYSSSVEDKSIKDFFQTLWQ